MLPLTLKYLMPPRQDELVKIVKKCFNIITKIPFVDFVGLQPDVGTSISTDFLIGLSVKRFYILFDRLTMLKVLSSEIDPAEIRLIR